MERTKKHKGPVSAILCSDIHLRETIPVCRTDDYWAAQWRKIDFISDLQKQYDCPVLHGGDLYDHWKPSPNLLRETIEHIPDKFFSIYGQHDLPQHNLSLADKCGMNVLWAGHHIGVLEGTHFGQEPDYKTNTEGEPSFIFKNPYRRILVWHVFNYKGKEPWPGCRAPIPTKLLRDYPDFDLVLTGDNHQSFTAELEGRILVNPGSMMRMDADQTDFEPRVYLWYAESNTVEPVYLPIEQSVISRQHIEQLEQRNDRIDAFVSRLDGKWSASMSFEDNLKAFEKVNKVRQSVMDIVYSSIETTK
jgi:DNA repair exonuclease SbcCD nuclease subunit